jgi:HEPN domain-containing protein
VTTPPLDAEEHERWRAEADRALRGARVQAEADLHNWGCFAAGQAAQLAVKGLLHGLGRAPWGRDLVRLGAMLADAGIQPPEHVADAMRRLGRHNIPSRYPDSHPAGPPGHGKRYNRETLDVRFKGKTIADVLDMTVEEAVDFFQHIPKIARRLRALHDVGLDYIRLGQPATTLSGGEAQRVKLASELCKVATGRTLYILDEPTTGLHFADVHRLLEMLDRLVEQGNTVVVIEHNLDVIKTADRIIDLGPEGGEKGGALVVGTDQVVPLLERREALHGRLVAEGAVWSA